MAMYSGFSEDCKRSCHICMHNGIYILFFVVFFVLFLFFFVFCLRVLDLEKVLYKEKETDGWALANRSQHAEVWKKKYPNESLQVIKVRLR